jgi:hypothetical protein
MVESLERDWVFAAQVDVAAPATGRVAGDRQRVDHGEGIALHQNAVFERARFTLVCVAHDQMRLARMLAHRLPLAAGGERRTAPSDQPATEHLAHDALGPELEGSLHGASPTARDVLVEARGIDDADPSQQHQAIAISLRHARRVRPIGSNRAIHRDANRVGVDVGQGCFVGWFSGMDDQRRRRAITQAEARTRAPSTHHAGTRRRLAHPELLDYGVGAAELAREVGTQMDNSWRARLEREQSVERRNAVRVGRSDR